MRAELTPLDLAGVTTQMALAYEKGRYFAGPAKCLGDVLVKRGRPVEALARDETALKYAPNWKQLKEGREVTARQKS
jgi:hypothetical protein